MSACFSDINVGAFGYRATLEDPYKYSVLPCLKAYRAKTLYTEYMLTINPYRVGIGPTLIAYMIRRTDAIDQKKRCFQSVQLDSNS